MITGFLAIVALTAWCGAVLLHVLYRLGYHPDADPIRPSGPID